MKKIKSLFFMGLVFLLVFSLPFSSIAAISDLMPAWSPATGSNALMTMGLTDDSGIMPFADEGGDGVSIYAAMYNATTNQLVRNIFPSKSGQVYSFPAPSDGCYYRFLTYRLNTAKAGTYNLLWTFKEANTTFDIRYVNAHMNRNNGFASSSVNGRADVSVVEDSTGNVWTVRGNFVVPYDVNIIAFEARIDKTSAFDFRQVSFSIGYGAVENGGTTSEFPTDSTGSANDVIINQNNQIVNTTNAIFDSIHELIQHISNQLAALWDQMFNLMHVPHMVKLDQIIDTIKNLDLEIEVNLDGLKNTINQTSQKIQDKIQATTDQITGGFDSSGIQSENDKLSGILDEYDKAESDIIDSVSGSFNDFVYPSISDFSSGTLASIAFFSGFMQNLFVSMGSFNMLITLGLTLVFVLILIGYYRIRS